MKYYVPLAIAAAVVAGCGPSGNGTPGASQVPNVNVVPAPAPTVPIISVVPTLPPATSAPTLAPLPTLAPVLLPPVTTPSPLPTASIAPIVPLTPLPVRT